MTFVQVGFSNLLSLSMFPFQMFLFRTKLQTTTNQGLCCSFNIKAADEIFVDSQYSDQVKQLQKYDRDSAYQTVPMPGKSLY
jgi:hypothetical protein